MRKSQEISKAIAILRKKGDKLSLIQADVLANRRGEVWVFERYVRDVADAERDESVYCAARDAAKYLIGRIEMAELIPDIEKYQKIAAPSPVRFRHRHAAVMRGRLSKAMSQPLPIRARRGTAKRRESEDLQASAFAGRCLRLRMKVGEAYPFLPAVCEKQAAGFLMEEIPAERRF